jgi:outer membrane protein assembly factor BamB
MAPVTAGAGAGRGATAGKHGLQAIGMTSGRPTSAMLLVRTDWLRFHFDNGNTGNNPYEKALSPSTVSRLGLTWTNGHNASFYSPPAVMGDIVYVGSDRYLSALYAPTGEDIWRQRSLSIYASPAVADGVVYAVDAYTGVSAFDTITGARLWRYRIGGDVSDSAPVVADGAVYVGNGDGLTAVDATTGKRLWSYPVGGTDSSPAVANGIVFIGGYQAIYAIDAATGTPRWSRPNDGIGSPAVAGGIVYATSSDHKVYALDASTGKKLWNFLADGSAICSPAIANGVVYAASTRSLYAIDAKSGALVWSRRLRGIGYLPSLVAANGVVYVTAARTGTGYAIDGSTGRKLWSSGPGEYQSSPVVVNGTLYLASTDNPFTRGGRITAFSLP